MATQDHPPTRTRDRQTRRTKRALLAAADELFAEGRVPTVAEVAERADVGRATAYRYFPTQEALLLETTFLGDSEPMRALPELADQIEDPAERVAEAVRRGAEWTLGREARLRAILRMSLDPKAGAERPARRRGYIAQLLASVKDDLDRRGLRAARGVAHAPVRHRPHRLAARQRRRRARAHPRRPRLGRLRARVRRAQRAR